MYDRYRFRIVAWEVKRAKAPEDNVNPQVGFSSVATAKCLRMIVCELMTCICVAIKAPAEKPEIVTVFGLPSNDGKANSSNFMSFGRAIASSNFDLKGRVWFIVAFNAKLSQEVSFLEFIKINLL